MKQNLLFWSLLLCSYTSMGQIMTIKDHASGEPIEMATLMSGNGKLFAATDANGPISLSSVTRRR